MAEAARSIELPDVEITIEQVVTGGPSGEVRYQIRIADGGVVVGQGEAPDVDLTLTTDLATAQAMASGSISVQDAFSAGRLRIGGDLALLLRLAPALAGLGQAVASVSAGTTFPPHG